MPIVCCLYIETHLIFVTTITTTVCVKNLPSVQFSNWNAEKLLYIVYTGFCRKATFVANLRTLKCIFFGLKLQLCQRMTNMRYASEEHRFHRINPITAPLHCIANHVKNSIFAVVIILHSHRLVAAWLRSGNASKNPSDRMLENILAIRKYYFFYRWKSD